MINLNHLKSDDPHVKYHCAKECIAMSEKNPPALYPRLGTFVEMLDGENNVLKWTALIVIGNLSAVDTKGNITRLIPRLQKFIKDPSLITAGNAVKALGKISQHKPRLRKKILQSLLVVEKTTYDNKGKPSPECRNIMIGHVITVLGEHADTLGGNQTIMRFLTRQTRNRRPAVSTRARAVRNQLR